MTTFRIAATGHSINYLPEYIAKEHGFFAQESLQLDVAVHGPWEQVLAEINTHRAQAALGGIWVPAMYHNRGRKLVSFAQISARCPLVIVGRNAETFAFDALRGKTVLIAGSSGASAGLFLSLLLSEHHISTSDIKLVQNLPEAMLAELFNKGMGDYMLTDPITAATMAKRSETYVVSSLAKTGGSIPWSVYYTETGTAGDNTDAQVRFVRSLNRGVDWLMNASAHSLRPLLARLFPTLDIAVALDVINHFKKWGMWHSTHIEKAAYDRWQKGLVQGHLIDAPVNYHELVNERIADNATLDPI